MVLREVPGVELKPDSGWWGLERSRAPGRWLRKIMAWRGYAEVVELGFGAVLAWRMRAQGVRGGQLKAGRGSWACVRDTITAGIAGMIRQRKRITATAVARSRARVGNLLEGRGFGEAGR